MKRNLKEVFSKFAKRSALAAGVVTGLVHGASSYAAGEGLAIVAKDDTTGAVTFSPDALANPIIDAVIECAKWGALVALVFIGVYIILKMFKGK